MVIEGKEIKTDNGGKRVILDAGEQGFKVTEKEWKDLILNNVKAEIQKEIKFDKASLFTVFGIFASVVTFLSIEIQILKTLCDLWDVIGFSIIILASLLTFILVLDYIGRGWRNDFKLEIKQFPWILMGFIVLLFTLGFISISHSMKEITCKDEAIFKKYKRDFSSKQLELEEVYDDKIRNLWEGIYANKRDIKDLRKNQNMHANE